MGSTEKENVVRQLPSIDDAIAYVKRTNFKLRTGRIGDSHCGCAITLCLLMIGEPIPNEEEDYDKENYVDPYSLFLKRFNLSPQMMWHGFDNVPFPGDADEPEFIWASEFRNRAIEEKLIIV